MLSSSIKVGMPLEKQKATIVAFTPKENGWLLFCIRWTDFMPYVVWDAWEAESEPEIACGNGSYCHTIGSAMYQYAHRGGDVSLVDEIKNNQ